jgi:hypothetical protein
LPLLLTTFPLAPLPSPPCLQVVPRVQGAIPKISVLPAPWGDKPYTAPADETLTSWGYLPAKYPDGFSPLSDQDVAAA